ncbi:MAG: DUF4349 domain-containing protein [Myxococcales bacterium]|nr:DUF4349 domain-containing protein [Myxococcales bacterium]
MARLPTSTLVLSLVIGLTAAGPARADEAAALPTVARSSQIVLGVVSGLETSRTLVGMLPPLGGRVLRSSESDAAIEVPQGRYRDFVTELRRLGELRAERVSTSDVSASLADARSAVRSARAALARREALSKIPSSVTDKLTVERELASAQNRIVLAEARAQSIVARGEVVSVLIRFEADEKESIEASPLPFPWLEGLGPANLMNPPSHGYGERVVLRSVADFGLSLDTRYVPRPEPLDGTRLAMAGTFDVRVLGEANPIGIFGGGDLSLGASSGFVYGAHFVLGAGMPIARRFAFGVGTGAGLDGITSVIPFGVVVPVELWLSWDTKWMQVSLRGQNGWVVASDDRQSGAKHSLFGDELSAGLHVIVADRNESSYTMRRSGWLFGAGYRELMGAEVVELRVGFGGIEADFSGGN